MIPAYVIYSLFALGGAGLGFGAGYVVFDKPQVDLSQAQKICGEDKTCAQYTSCLITNSRESGGQNPRNCDSLLDLINFDGRQRVLMRTFEYCSKQDSRDAATICREFLRPK